MSDKKTEQEVITDPSDANVLNKYKSAAEIANDALKYVVANAKPDGKIVELCSASDKLITEATGKIFNKGKIEKGVAFPTCISVNHIVGHFSPLSDHAATFKAGDLVKVDLGVQIDGYIATAAHTFVITDEQVTGRQADVILATVTAAEAAVKLLRPGHKNTEVSDIIKKIADDYKVTPVQGVLSHQMTRNTIDGEKVILGRVEVDQKVDEHEFALNEVYAIDIVMSTGEGKPKEVDERTTVYKRNVSTVYKLKLQASREILSQIDKSHKLFPFTLRDLDEKKARFGITEAKQHDLVQAYPVLYEKEGEFVAQIKLTALILSNGTVKITGLPIDYSKIKSEHKIVNEDVQKVLQSSAVVKTEAQLKAAAKKKAKAKAKKEAEKAAAEAPAS